MEATIIIISISYPVDCGTYINTLRLLFLLPSTDSKFVYQSRIHRIPEETKLKEMEDGRNVNLMRMAEKLFAGKFQKLFRTYVPHYIRSQPKNSNQLESLKPDAVLCKI
jgi:hypothetical protein